MLKRKVAPGNRFTSLCRRHLLRATKATSLHAADAPPASSGPPSPRRSRRACRTHVGTDGPASAPHDSPPRHSTTGIVDPLTQKRRRARRTQGIQRACGSARELAHLLRSHTQRGGAQHHSASRINTAQSARSVPGGPAAWSVRAPGRVHAHVLRCSANDAQHHGASGRSSASSLLSGATRSTTSCGRVHLRHSHRSWVNMMLPASLRLSPCSMRALRRRAPRDADDGERRVRREEELVL
mgnify:CR=1 FL=1